MLHKAYAAIGEMQELENIRTANSQNKVLK